MKAVAPERCVLDSLVMDMETSKVGVVMGASAGTAYSSAPSTGAESGTPSE